MQHSQPHKNLYYADIFLSWGDRFFRRLVSLRMILVSTFISYLSTPSSGGINMIIRSSRTDTRINNVRTFYGSE